MADEAKFYCRKCDSEIDETDLICSNCGCSIKETGRRIEISIQDAIRLSDSVALALTKSEQRTVINIWKWLAERISEFELSEVEIGFPSGVKVKFVRQKRIKD